MTFGDRLRELREERGLSQREVHRRSGLSMSYIYYVEKGRVTPGDDNLKRFAKALGVRQKDLFEDLQKARFAQQGVDPDASVLLKELGDLSEEEKADLMTMLDTIAARRRKIGQGAPRERGRKTS